MDGIVVAGPCAVCKSCAWAPQHQAHLFDRSKGREPDASIRIHVRRKQALSISNIHSSVALEQFHRSVRNEAFDEAARRLRLERHLALYIGGWIDRCVRFYGESL